MTTSSFSALFMLWMILPESSRVSHAWTSPTTILVDLPSSTTSSRSPATRIGRTRLRIESTISVSNNALRITATTTIDAGTSWDDTEGEDEVHELERMTVSELKERLRSIGQKVTGTKMELIQRLSLMSQHQHTQHNNAMEDSTNSIYTNNGIPIHHSLSQLPAPLRQAFIRYTTSSTGNLAVNDDDGSASTSPTSSTPFAKLLPIQQQSYPLISTGRDTVLFSPTGSGKSLAFILPLAARLLGWKSDGSLQFKKEAQRQHYMKRGRNTHNGNDSFSSLDQKSELNVASPLILIVEPSRELARQVGKIWNKFHPSSMIGGGNSGNSKQHVVTVYGGVPMTRHAAKLSSKTDIVIGTPGRIRELIREKYLSTKDLRSIVLDEADTLLNFGDNPEVEWLLGGIANDYQLVLSSATINKRVEKFVTDIMELEVGEEGYVVVKGSNESDVDVGDSAHVSTDSGIEAVTESNLEYSLERTKPAAVRHWSMPASPTSRVALTSDLVITMTPRQCIVFVPTKAEAESVAQELKERLSTTNDISIYILHGDMVQQARSRTISSFREESDGKTRILVATDVASRGLDLPAVDLVLQYCVPRKMGKDGTFDSELYIHRTGRAGRFGNTRTADVILLYDRSQGEETTLNKLTEVMKQMHEIEIVPRQLPSSSKVMEASYDRVMRIFERFDKEENRNSQSLVQYFVDKLQVDLIQRRNDISGSNERESFLIHRLALAMASLSGLEEVVPARSLLTGDSRYRTVRVRHDSVYPLVPSEVTKVVKGFGSGKLGRISMCDDGSAVFDLEARKAAMLVESAAANKASGWRFDLPETLQ